MYSGNNSYPRQKGIKHHKAKPKLYYSIVDSTRSGFKRICKNQGWDINEFEEVESGGMSFTHKKYYYALKILFYKGE